MVDQASVLLELDERGPGPADGPAEPAEGGVQPTPAPPARRLDDRVRSERTMIAVRGAAVVFALFEVLTYDAASYPGRQRTAALVLVAVLAATNVVMWRAAGGVRDERSATVLSLIAMAVDAGVAAGFVAVYTFDATSAHWAILYLVPLAGAVRFQLRGALATWALMTVFYSFREAWGSDRWGYDTGWESIAYRMGIGLLVALVAGLMARDLTREKARADAALGHLRLLDEQRQQLVWALAHDLRNPLTAVRGSIQTLVTRGAGLDETTSRYLLGIADRHAARLQYLACDLLDLARLEHGQLELSPVELPLREQVDRALAYADPRGAVSNRIDPDLLAYADPDRLEQVIVNLAGNALQHGRPPFVVDAAVDGDRVAVTVGDHGPGVPAAERAGMFDAFAHSGTSVGLGLWIVKSLVEAQGGTVAYEDNDGGGARFVVRLRRAAPTP